jgi:regulator of replication initiation timing
MLEAMLNEAIQEVAQAHGQAADQRVYLKALLRQFQEENAKLTEELSQLRQRVSASNGAKEPAEEG